jgi:2-methylcitrate dehydratase PrpD
LVVGENRIRAYKDNTPPFGKWREVVELGKRVDIAHDERIDAIQRDTGIFVYAECEIKMKDGRVLSGKSGWPKGFFENPMTREERLEKFYGQALIVLTQDKADKIVELVEKLEELNDIRPIVENIVC